MGIIGQALDRADGRLKVTGTARYAGEFKVPDMVHAALVQSTIAAGAIGGFDLDAARAMPGVLEIITPDNALKLATQGGPPQTVKAPLLQDNVIYYNGQHVAIVVADTLDQALAAAARVRVRYHLTEPITEMDAVLDRAYPPRHFRNGARPPDSHRGDAAAAFAQAAVKVDATYVTPTEHHNPMEPHATIARWDGDRLTVWTATQGISGTQATLATLFRLDKTQVHVICPFVGGGFGCKGSTWPPATLTAMAARIVRRPVKLELTRAQMFTSNGYRPRTIQKLKFAAGADGSLVSMRHDGFSQMSQPVLGEFAEPVALSTEMLYACPNVAISHRVVPMNAGLPTYMRAPGESSGNFALESAIDELAVALKIDPLEFRLHNYCENDPHDNKPFASKLLHQCYQQGANLFGWSRRNAAPRSMRNGQMLVGWGMATSTYPTNQQSAHVRVRIGSGNTIILQSGTQDLGTGTYTVMAQVAAETLGVPYEAVRFELGDSSYPPAPVSGGSSTVPSVAPAVRAACEAARTKLFDLARGDARRGWHNLPNDALRLENGHVVGPDGRVAIAELVWASGQDGVETTAGASLDDTAKRFSRHAFGAQFAEVQVDPDLGTIRVTRWVGAFDGGRVLNAKTAHSQLIGGITFGIGMALLEETLTDRRSGRIVNANVADYLLPVNADVPDIQAILVPNDEHNSNPLGVKGIGELPMVGVAAAIANAVYHATGKRVRKVPIRIEDVLT